MMPGENHSKTAGIASEAVGSCQNCTSLQQNLNEYVEALLTLKQKVIDSDHLFAEYQQKCDYLKEAERENKTLKCQLEQMLKTISPCEQKEQLLKSLHVELEEKMSTVDVAQESDLDIIRENKACKKCDMVKKKHNAKLKKVEEVASKHVKIAKQLHHEKRVIEKELTKLQKKLDRQKQKTMKNAHTQVANDQPVVKLDKKKIRILLEELWGCIESSTENIESDTLQLETILRKENFQNPDDSTPLDHFSSSTLSCTFETFSESTVVYGVNDSTWCKDSNAIQTFSDAFKEYTEDKPIQTETMAKEDLKDSGLINSDHESDMEEVVQIMNWAKPLPHLLSPLTFSPLTTKCVFGEVTDSSDESSDERNKANNYKTLENKITGVQGQTNISPCPETGNVNRKCGENVTHQYNSASIDTECIKSLSECCSSKWDPTAITAMETDKKHLEVTSVQTETNFGVANIALENNGLTEQNPAEKYLHSVINFATTFEKALPWYSNLKNPDKKLSSFNNSEVKSLNPSSTNMMGMTTELKQPFGTVDLSGKLVIDNPHCPNEHASSSETCSSVNASKLCEEKALENDRSPTEICSKGLESAKSFQLYNATNAGENKVYEGLNIAGENHVQNHKNDTGKNFSLDKNIDNSNISNRCRDNLFFPTQPEMCLNEFNQKFNNKSIDFKDNKESNSCNEDVDTGKPDCTTSVNVEMCSTAKIEQLSLEEKSEISNSTSIGQYDHTRTISLYYTGHILDNDPKYIHEVSLQKDPKYIPEESLLKESISLEQKLPMRGVEEDGDCYKAKADKVGYSMQESIELMPALTEHLSASFVGRERECLSMEKLEDNIKGEMFSDLQCIANKTEKIEKHPKPVGDEWGSASKRHTIAEQCEVSLSEMVKKRSFDSSLCIPVSLTASKAVSTDVQSVIETQIDICSQNQTVCDQSCSRHNQAYSSVSPNENVILSQFDTNNADRFLNKLEGKCVLTEDMTPLSNQLNMKVSMDLSVVSRDQLDTTNKELWKGGTPKKQAKLDSFLEKANQVCTLESNGDSPIINESKEMPCFPLGEQHHLNVYSTLSNVFNEATEKTYANEKCAASMDSSDEDRFPVRKVNYRKAVSRKPMDLNNYCKIAFEGIEEKVCNVDLESNDTLCKPVLTDVTEREFTYDLSACGISGNVSLKAPNDTPIEHNTSVIADIIVDPESGKTACKNAVDHYLSEKETITATLEECERQKQNPVSENNQYVNSTGQNSNTLESDVKKTIPGKNLIWNFERTDDSIINPRSGKHKQKVNANILQGGSENSFNKTALNLDKRLKLNKVTKECHQQKFAQGEQILQNIYVGETVLANADTSTNSDHSPEMITKVRAEMGPPLPPLLGPLLATPPKSIHHQSPILSSSSCSSLPSPLDDLISPLPSTPFPQLVSPLSDGRIQKSPVHVTPSPAEKANRRILSSPLQFCAATPKHALPVPGRLPLSASSSSTSIQENSVKILDTMYPELSARARTLNILKGNVQLNRGLPRDGKNVSVSQITGFKSITSTSTAFIKTGGNSKVDSSKDKSGNCESKLQLNSIGSPNKRTSDAVLMPRSAKRLRLDAESPFLETMKHCLTTPEIDHAEVQKCQEPCRNLTHCELLPDVVKGSDIDEDIISKALKKIEDLCFDLLPVIRSHIFVGTIPKVPVMRNEEKEVIYEFSNSKKNLADRFLQVVLKKIKTGKRSIGTTYLQALCRVYVGLCRQLGDIERARILGYSILKEDFPDPDRLLLFIVSSWNDIISTHGVLSKAIQAVLKNLAKDDVGSCLGVYLNWEKTPPMNVTVLLSSVLMAVQLCPDGKFQQSEKYGEDLTDSIWEYVFAVDLLCRHRKWVWTHDRIISKQLWPLLDKWVKRKKGNPNVPFVSDLIVATVLRLVGHLCQMGLMEGYVVAVKNIGAVITAFLQHANEEGMSWGVQLACVYMLFDVAPSNLAAIHKTLQAWKEAAKNDIPPAVENCMKELESMCELAK